MFKGTVSSKMTILFTCLLFMLFHPYTFYFVSSVVHKGNMFQHNYNKWGVFKVQKGCKYTIKVDHTTCVLNSKTSESYDSFVWERLKYSPPESCWQKPQWSNYWINDLNQRFVNESFRLVCLPESTDSVKRSDSNIVKMIPVYTDHKNN